MSSRDFAFLSFSEPLLRFRIRPSTTAFSLASPSGKPDSPACSMVVPVETPPSSLFSLFAEVHPSVTRAGMCERLHLIGSIRVRPPMRSCRRTSTHDNAVLVTLPTLKSIGNTHALNPGAAQWAPGRRKACRAPSPHRLADGS